MDDALLSENPYINYMEVFVDECIAKRSLDEFDDDLILDIKCIALNHCPAWYVRSIDKASSHMPRERLLDICETVNAAVDIAIERVRKGGPRDRASAYG